MSGLAGRKVYKKKIFDPRKKKNEKRIRTVVFFMDDQDKLNFVDNQKKQ
jgi:hypothetical protein